MFTSLRRWWRQKLVSDIGTWRKRFVRCPTCQTPYLRETRAKVCSCGAWLVFEPYPKPAQIIPSARASTRDINDLLRRAKAKV